MAHRHAGLQRDLTEHRSGLLVGSAHRVAPFLSGGSMVVRGDRRVDPSGGTISATC